MAVTVASTTTFNGKRCSAFGTITGDNSYPTGGWPLSAAQIKALACDGNAKGSLDQTRFVAEVETGGRTIALDRTNSKLKAFAGGSEVANATDLSAVSWRFECSSFSE